MKKITLFILLLISSVGFSQNAPISFETGQFGSNWTFASFENSTGIGYEKVTNPFATGINTSATVGKFTALVAGQPWAGCESAHASGVNGIGTFTFSLSNCIVKVMVYKSVISDVGIKFAESSGDAQAEVKVANTKINEWEELTFDMSNSIGKGATGIIDQIIVFPDFQARTAENVCYFDNVTFSEKSTPIVSGATLPLNFESGSYAFIDFDGGVSTKIANPHITGINTSANVAQMVKGAGQPWGGSKIKMAAPVDFSTKKLFKVKVWSPVAGKKLLLKFEKSDGTGGFEKESTGVTAANTWEELSFDFTGVVGVTNLDDNMVLIFDLGTMGDGSANSTYLFDDITQSAVSGGTVTGATLPLDFESSSYTFVDFDGGAATKITNPHNIGINTSANVAQMVKGAGQPWAGSKLKMAAPVDFSTKKLFKVKVWSPVAGKKLLLKFEKSDGTGGFEKESTGVTAANTWEELSFDFTGVAGVTNLDDNMIFIFDLGTMGDGSANSTYLFDDITQSAVSGVGSSKTQMNLPVTFDDSTVDYGLIGFGGADVSSVVVDPTSSTNKVAKVVKSATAELWAGTTISAAAGLGFSGVIPFTASATKMSVRVWSPNAGIKVRLKVEEHGDNTHTVETETAVTTASGWETLEFNFATPATGTAALNLSYKYDKASIFFNFGTTGAIAGEKTYYFDDVVFGASLGTTKFETSNVKMYPNPVTNYLTIEANSTIERVSVYNLLGQEVLVKSPKSNSTILQTSELEKGVYIVKTEIDGKVNVAKIIKE
jgi:hypothetical protein